jgi:hypothetical protein
MASKEVGVTGNYGLKDQACAFKWVITPNSEKSASINFGIRFKKMSLGLEVIQAELQPLGSQLDPVNHLESII